METPLALEDITGLSLTLIGTLIESYIREGYGDPTMFQALNATAKLTEQFKARLEYDGEHGAEALEQVTDLLVNLQVTAIECGEIVNRLIEEHGLPVSKDDWTRTDGE
jgi:hypothetical protein